jgi:uncharacterized membrane protein YoaK (UPF0700 family)
LFVLALAAGYVDAVSFFGAGVFTANMTGNTVLFAGSIAAHWWPRLPGTIGPALPLLSILAFVGAAATTAAVVGNRPSESALRRPLLSCVAFLLAASAVGWHVLPVWTIVIALSASMGMQSVVAVRLGMHGVSTTYVTGTLVSATIALFGRRVAARTRAGVADLAVWALYLLGATAGAFGEAAFGTRSLWAAALVVALSAAFF